MNMDFDDWIVLIIVTTFIVLVAFAVFFALR